MPFYCCWLFSIKLTPVFDPGHSTMPAYSVVPPPLPPQSGAPALRAAGGAGRTRGRRALPSTPLGNTDLFIPTPERPVRVRGRSMQMDEHLLPHQHDWAQLAYCSSGVVQVTVATPAEMTYIVPPTRGVWIAPGLLHSITTLEAAEFRTLYISITVIPPGWRNCRVITISPLARELILALDLEEIRHRPSCAAAPEISARLVSTPRECLLMAMLSDELASAHTHNSLGISLPHRDQADKRLRALCDAVLRDPADQSTLAERAALFGASERTMARLFRNGLGVGYQQWRQQAMLAHALPLLARGQPIGDVAAATGYASQSAFSAMFKAAMGESPRFFLHKK